MRDGAADRLAEDELVVVPVEVGRDERVFLGGEEFGGDAQAVRERVRDYRVGEGEAAHGRVLGEFHLAPFGAQGGEAEARSVEEGALVESGAASEARHDHGRGILLESHADSGVYVAAPGLCALAQDAAVWEIHFQATRRQEAARLSKRLVQLFSQ